MGMMFEFNKMRQQYPVGIRLRLKSGGGEAEVSGYAFSNGAWYVCMKDGGPYLYSRLQMLEAQPRVQARPGEGQVQALLEDAKQEICSCYCKWPGLYGDEEAMLEEKCFPCPLSRL